MSAPAPLFIRTCMTVGDLITQLREDYQREGLTALKYTAQNVFHGTLSRLGFWMNYGGNFYEQEWDLLILVDACRYDLMEEVVDEYDYVETSTSFVSCASHSREWLHKTFKENNQTSLDRLQLWKDILINPDDIEPFRDRMDMKDMSDTAYISWNMFTEMLDEDYFAACELVGRNEWPPESDILEPRKLTDRTISVMREHDPERTIVHYMQPHNPFRSDEDRDASRNIWERVQHGEKSKEEAWNEYKDNLQWVMNDIRVLLNNVDAEKVVISSDHGNAIGEWWCYGHRPYVPLDAEKRVPWVKTTAVDSGEYTPEDDTEHVDMNSSEVEERLRNLGYK